MLASTQVDGRLEIVGYIQTAQRGLYAGNQAEAKGVFVNGAFFRAISGNPAFMQPSSGVYIKAAGD